VRRSGANGPDHSRTALPAARPINGHPLGRDRSEPRHAVAAELRSARRPVWAGGLQRLLPSVLPTWGDRVRQPHRPHARPDQGAAAQGSGRGTHPVPCPADRLFACGATDNGEYLFWLTDSADAPDHWRVAVNEARGPGWLTYDGTLTSLVVSVLQGTVSVPLFPRGLLGRPPRFTPSRPTLWKPSPRRTLGPWTRDRSGPG
jgi:hypothetical protein